MLLDWRNTCTLLWFAATISLITIAVSKMARPVSEAYQMQRALDPSRLPHNVAVRCSRQCPLTHVYTSLGCHLCVWMRPNFNGSV
jgi:hypothetical protein